MSVLRFVSVLLFAVASSTLAVDEIKDLPGLTFDVKFKHYSGFLRASETRHLHYWLVESQNDPSTDPLLFWFNGGPGCSSLLGLLGEHGPYQLNFDNSTLKENPYAWNKFANVVYMESPAGVGFAYADHGDDGVYNDNRTSAENYEAIKLFLREAHPEYRHRSVFIAGESYGGMYVPTLAARILEGHRDFPINLTGIIIGNGFVDDALAATTQAAWSYAHGLIDEADWAAMKKCCKGDVDGCDYQALDDDCQRLLASTEFPRVKGMNVYDIYRNCSTNPTAIFIPLKSDRRSGTIAPPTSLPPCDPYYAAYLNRMDVREALNVPDHVGEWAECDHGVHVAYDWGETVRPEVQKIAASGVRTLLYYGDTDAACNSLQGQKFAASLGLEQKDPKTPWMYGAELGGFKTVYEGGVTYVTVRGVGHMVPQWKPAESQQVIRRFLADKEI